MKARVIDCPWVGSYRYLVEQRAWFRWHPVDSYKDLESAISRARGIVADQIVWEPSHEST